VTVDAGVVWERCKAMEKLPKDNRAAVGRVSLLPTDVAFDSDSDSDFDFDFRGCVFIQSEGVFFAVRG
jgi:hypothetical protein